MPLSNELRDVAIEFQCPSCSCPMVRRGSWLKTIAGFKCDSSRSKVRLGYEEKLAIFERHLRKVSAGTKSVNNRPCQRPL